MLNLFIVGELIMIYLLHAKMLGILQVRCWTRIVLFVDS